jgi:hypothetical protein
MSGYETYLAATLMKEKLAVVTAQNEQADYSTMRLDSAMSTRRRKPLSKALQLRIFQRDG